MVQWQRFYNSIIKITRKYLEKNPYLSNSLVYGALYSGAILTREFLCEKLLAEKPKPIDLHSIVTYAWYGTFVAAPILTAWYRYLDKSFPSSLRHNISHKLLLDQFVASPNMTLLFYKVMCTADGKDFDQEILVKFVPTYILSTIYWVPIQIINFMFVAPHGRISFIGACTFMWVMILSFIQKPPIDVHE